jgi:predicted DCC family thiol-disulfide oxidoreductase YuxK
MSAKTDFIVLFDGACPLCRAEIDHYRGLDTAGAVVWRDVAADPGAARACALDPAEALARFHVVEHGRPLSGAAAFAALWRRLPAPWSWLGALCRLPGVTFLGELAYRGFLRLRPALQRLAR